MSYRSYLKLSDNQVKALLLMIEAEQDGLLDINVSNEIANALMYKLTKGEKELFILFSNITDFAEYINQSPQGYLYKGALPALEDFRTRLLEFCEI